MATTRLNSQIRRQIVTKMLDHAFGDERKEIQDMEVSLGQMIYDDLYDAETREKMAALPTDFFSCDGVLYVAFGGQRDNVAVSGPVAYCHRGYEEARRYGASDPRSKLHAEIYRKKCSLREREDKARGEAMAALEACSTLRQLGEAWPEAAEFAGDVAVPASPTRALAVSVPGLNRQLRLGKFDRKS